MNNLPPDVDDFLKNQLPEELSNKISSRDLEMYVLRKIRGSNSLNSNHYWMRRTAVLASFLIILLTAGWFLYIYPNSSGEIHLLAGNGEIDLNGRAGVLGENNKRFSLGDTLETMENQVKLSLSDTTFIILDKQSRITYDSRKRISVSKGRLHYNHSGNGSSEISFHTPLGIIQPIGTIFDLEVSPDKNNIQVFDGSVAVSLNNVERIIESGYEADINSNAIEDKSMTTPHRQWWPDTAYTPWTKAFNTN